MTPTQFRTAIEKLGLSQVRTGEFLGMNPRTARAWALGESPIPESVAKLLRLMIKLDLKPEDVK